MPLAQKILIFCLLALNSIDCAPSTASKVLENGKSSWSLNQGFTEVVPVIKVVSEEVSQLADGPYWDAPNGHLYYVDAFKGDLCRLDVTTKELERLNLGDIVSVIIPYNGGQEPGKFLISRRHELLKLDWATQTTEVVAALPEGKERFNDGKYDPRGRFFIGSLVEGALGIVVKGGSLYRLDGDILTAVAAGYTISNGMVWSNDSNHTKLYFIDTAARKIFVFDYDIETGTPSNSQVLVDCNKNEDFHAIEYPDGLVLDDDDGNLWVCMYAGGRLVKIDVDTGRVVDQVHLPTAGVPSSLARGFYEGQDGYYVTTAENYINHKPDDGKILHLSFMDLDTSTTLSQN